MCKLLVPVTDVVHSCLLFFSCESSFQQVKIGSADPYCTYLKWYLCTSLDHWILMQSTCKIQLTESRSLILCSSSLMWMSEWTLYTKVQHLTPSLCSEQMIQVTHLHMHNTCDKANSRLHKTGAWNENTVYQRLQFILVVETGNDTFQLTTGLFVIISTQEAQKICCRSVSVISPSRLLLAVADNWAPLFIDFLVDFSLWSPRLPDSVNAGNSITLIWIPGHTGIRGNERADEAAKAALSSTVSTMKCPASDFIPELTMHYRAVWQAEWDGCSANKLHSIKPHLGYCSITHLSRRDAVILRRLRIGHTRVTHKYHSVTNVNAL